MFFFEVMDALFVVIGEWFERVWGLVLKGFVGFGGGLGGFWVVLVGLGGVWVVFKMLKSDFRSTEDE